MTGDGMCGVFIPDRVLAGWWRSQWEGEGPDGGRVGAQQVVEGGRYLSASAGEIIVVYWVAVCFC